MRLKHFSVTNYRSITKAEKLPLGDLTVLVGPNNEGKSNIIEALVLGMQELASPTPRLRRARLGRRGRPEYDFGDIVGYDWDRDFPKGLQDARPEGRTTMNFDFELTPEEVEEFYDEVGSRFNETLPLSLSFGPTGSSSFSVRKKGPSQKALAKKREELAQFVAARVQIQYVPAVRTGSRAANIVRRMVQRELLRAAETDEAYAKALANLRAAQDPILREMSESIAGRLKSLLPEVASVRLEPREDRLTREVYVLVDDGISTDLLLRPSKRPTALVGSCV